MKRYIYLLTLAIVAMTACGPNKADLQKQIASEEKIISMIDIASEDERAHNLVQLYVQYADNFDQDTLAPIYLFRAADISANLGDTEDALIYMHRIIDNYPDYKDIPMCYFLCGLYLEQSGDYELAKAAYEEYLELFPDHYFASDVRIMLSHLGESYEEMLTKILEDATDTNIVKN